MNNNWIEQDSDDVILLEPTIPWYSNLSIKAPIGIIEINNIHKNKIKFNKNNINDKKCKKVEDFGGKGINKTSDMIAKIMLSFFVVSLEFNSIKRKK